MREWRVPKTASRGYAIGPVYVVKQTEVIADSRKIATEEIEAEIKRFEDAVAKAQEDLLELAASNEIFAAHYALVGDIAIYDGVTGKIKDALMNAEAALMQTRDEYVMVFESMDDEYMRERAADMKDVSGRLLYALKGIEDNPFKAMKERSIIAAKDLAPSDTAKMNMDLVAGFITEEGGVTSHVSIIAKNLGIPCLVGAGPMLGEMESGMQAVLDAEAGVLYLDPDQDLVETYRKKAEELARMTEEMEKLSTLPSETLDGHKFSICANVGSPADIRNALKYQIDGVGLFRSEFLYMENDHFPTEEEQFAAYKEAAELLAGKELTIRTLDIGGDKGLDYYEFPKEENPFLGYRAIRMCLDQTDMFKTQLRAILRASAFGYIRIMYPMMISLEELQQANVLLEECKAELREAGIVFDEKIQVGIMVETPAAVMMADDFAECVDFFSIGTNDLTQYVLAVDRGNPKISERYNSFHPAVLRAICHTIQAAHHHGAKAGMCGEFAGDEKASGLLLGMGLDEFSMSANTAARIKYQLRNTSFEEAQKMAENVIRQSTVEKVMENLK
ncbi:MAG: phosphoenolpyruvate--protein phosphotransferase [Candidatus Choladocola sp.]|nr:phosphoenolpyruvate--protein phosphotransferase [Candidatus Choladocola sp.]